MQEYLDNTNRTVFVTSHVIDFVEEVLSMVRVIFFRELYKIRWMWCILFLVNTGVSINVWLTTRRLFLLDHPEVVWYRVIHLGQIYFEPFRFLPLFCGILVACFQFLPEMWGERLKHSLHSPVSPQLLIFVHMGVGLAALETVLLPVLGILWGITVFYFPGQMLVMAFVTALPWFMAGIAAYLGGALVFLEPSTRLRVCNALISAAVAGIYLFHAEPGSYAPCLLLLVFPLILMGISVLYPAFRFRYRSAY